MKDEKDAVNAGSNTTPEKRRRKLLAALAAGGGVALGSQSMPKKWVSPIVDSVTLPAHAQTTGPSLTDPCQVSVEVGDTINATVVGQVLGTGALGGITINLAFQLLNNGSAVGAAVQTQAVTNNNGTYTALVSLGVCPPTANAVRVTATSNNPLLVGQTAVCTAGFTKNCPV